MSEIEQIEDRIRKLPREELAQFRAWFAEFDALAWDRQIEADSRGGRLEQLVEQSKAEYIGSHAEYDRLVG